LNPHASRRQNLNLVRLQISPHPHFLQKRNVRPAARPEPPPFANSLPSSKADGRMREENLGHASAAR
jgi:hypothetical protein